MVTGVTTNMSANVMANAVVPAQLKETPIKSDRRSNKPIMEKRRRARINNCLNELKTLILDATKKDPARHSKLEKADILEKTVKHLQELQRQQAAMQQAADPKIINKFKAGFTDCANEVSRFPGLEPAQRRRLLQHLSNCINGVKSELHQQQRQQQQSLHAQVVLPSPPSSPEQESHTMSISNSSSSGAAAAPYLFGQIQQNANGYFLPNGMQVIPTKLPNGSIALVLPQSLPQQQQQQLLQQQQQQQQLAAAAAVAAAAAAAAAQQQQQSSSPMLVSMPQRTASTGSASSHSSAGYESAPSSNGSYAPPSPASSSYEPMDVKPSVIQRAPQSAEHQQPLSLVMKKQIKEEEQPWRPW
ncbi:h [Drosophila busckii]|uniref:H n=1 Tax=Drosophila busckii TaxID=30019 RepID=A0A0M4EYY8_DROBS|nr:protein hairy [Drosophila busckii]ALC43507.1 h [Drosophila busckii] [Drosophila busckii]